LVPIITEPENERISFVPPLSPTVGDEASTTGLKLLLDPGRFNNIFNLAQRRICAKFVDKRFLPETSKARSLPTILPSVDLTSTNPPGALLAVPMAAIAPKLSRTGPVGSVPCPLTVISYLACTSTFPGFTLSFTQESKPP